MHNGIRRRTFRYFLLSMIVIILGFSFFFLQYMNINSRERFEEDHAFALRKTAESIEHLLADIQQNAYYLSCNESLAAMLVNRSELNANAQMEMLGTMFGLQISPFATSITSASAALLLDPQYPLSHAINLPFSLYRMGSRRLYSALEVQHEAWYRQVQMGSSQIYAFTDGGAPDSIFLAHQLRNIWIADQRFDENVGVVIYSLPASVLRSTLQGSQIESGSVTLVMYQDAVLCSTAPDLFPDSAALDAQAVSWRDAPPPGGAALQQDIGGQKYAIRCQDAGAGWTVVLLVPVSGLPRSLTSMMWMYAIVFGVLVVVALVLSALFARRLVRPIRTLAETMHYQHGAAAQPTVVTVPRSSDEIETLYLSYNAMVERINQATEQLQEKNETIRVTQLKALQAQINPHFVYNTLDSVICIALLEEQHDIATMVTSLIQLLKYSVDFSQMTVTLSEEINYLEQYIQIQQLRYGDNFRFINDVSASYHGVRVAKIVLQPLVENALFHAQRTEEDLVIRVWCSEEEGKLLIHVTDNGSGANVEALNRMLDGSIAREYYGIGIRNVDQRIRIMAGEGYGIHYERAPGGGLDAVITIPLLP